MLQLALNDRKKLISSNFVAKHHIYPQNTLLDQNFNILTPTPFLTPLTPQNFFDPKLLILTQFDPQTTYLAQLCPQTPHLLPGPTFEKNQNFSNFIQTVNVTISPK